MMACSSRAWLVRLDGSLFVLMVSYLLLVRWHTLSAMQLMRLQTLFFSAPARLLVSEDALAALQLMYVR